MSGFPKLIPWLVVSVASTAMLQAETAPETGLWKSAVKTDPMTDKQVVTLVLGTVERDRALVLRCDGKDLEVYINWGAYIANRDPGTRNIDIIKRLGDGKPDKDYWSPSNDHTATFHRGDHRRFVRDLLAVDTAVFQVTPFQSPTLTAVFDVRGLAAALPPLAEGCPIK